MCTTYVCFLAALLSFESGWDRERYDAGIIVDSQLTEWAKGPVETHYPGYKSWSQLSEQEWQDMSYRSMNSLGFVGYQFGEALLIDLGYYKDDVYYGAGAETNTWDGTWTGKNGVSSLKDFMTGKAQNVAIQEAFGYNLQILQNQLSVYGKSLDDYVGQSRSYVQNGETVSVKLTLSGILAASHLRGAWGTASLLLDDAVSADENGTSILQYVKQFGGYETPAIDSLVAFHDGRVIGDEGLGSLHLPGEKSGTDEDEEVSETPPDEIKVEQPDRNEPADDPAEVPESDTIELSYAWGQFRTIDGFEPATDRIDFGSLPAADVLVEDTAEGLKVTVKNNGDSGYLLRGVRAADLSISANTTAASWNPILTQAGGIADQLRALGSHD